MSHQRHASVWDAIEDMPAEAENMKLRSERMMALKRYITPAQISQADAAKLFGVTQPRSLSCCAARSTFGLDALANMAAAAGLHVECV